MTLISQPIAIAIKNNPVQQTQVGKYLSFFPLFTLFLHLYKINNQQVYHTRILTLCLSG